MTYILEVKKSKIEVMTRSNILQKRRNTHQWLPVEFYLVLTMH